MLHIKITIVLISYNKFHRLARSFNFWAPINKRTIGFIIYN